jgi:hypothetical protein
MAAITKEGRALRGRMWPAYAAAIRRHFADCFTEKELAVLGDYLGRLSAAVRTRSK